MIEVDQALRPQTIEISTFASVLNAFNSAIILVDKHASCMYANVAARTMLSLKDPLALKNGQLSLRRLAATIAFKEIVHTVAIGSRLHSAEVPVTRDDGTPMILHIRSLHHHEIQRDIGRSEATAAIFMSSSLAPLHIPADALAMLYNLTPSETRILEMIVAGETQGNIAAKLGLAVSTIKTHLLHVFEKTGCQRQADLVRLAASLYMPL
jgi:DNA-binding CsgD family transcriptional regulator